jgi:hypothetical protein
MGHLGTGEGTWKGRQRGEGGYGAYAPKRKAKKNEVVSKAFMEAGS